MANVKEYMQSLDALIAIQGMCIRLQLWLKLIGTGILFISITKNIMNMLVGDITTTDSL